jgi:hypothetical protein
VSELISMKKVILAILTIALFNVACNKAKTTVESSTSATTKNIRSEDDRTEYFGYTKNIVIYSEDHTDAINAVVTAHSQEVLDKYCDEVTIYFTPLASVPIITPEIITNPEVISEENIIADAVRIVLDDENRNGSNGYTIHTKKTRSGYSYKEEWDSKNDNTQINWVYTGNSNNDLKVRVEYKNCAFCWTRYDLVNVFMGSYFPQANYYKNCRRLYVTVWNNWHNRSVSFY